MPISVIGYISSSIQILLIHPKPTQLPPPPSPLPPPLEPPKNLCTDLANKVFTVKKGGYESQACVLELPQMFSRVLVYIKNRYYSQEGAGRFPTHPRLVTN